MKEFKDKVLVVTGGGRGIGRAIAVEAAKRGMKCVVNDIDGDAARSVVAELKALGTEAVAQEADITLYENIETPSDGLIFSATTLAAPFPDRSGSCRNAILTGSPSLTSSATFTA